MAAYASFLRLQGTELYAETMRELRSRSDLSPRVQQAFRWVSIPEHPKWRYVAGMIIYGAAAVSGLGAVALIARARSAAAPVAATVVALASVLLLGVGEILLKREVVDAAIWVVLVLASCIYWRVCQKRVAALKA